MITDVQSLRDIISKARIAQSKWESKALNERIRYMYALRKYIVRNIDDLSEAISKENGKVQIDALTSEILPITMAITYFCKNSKRFLEDEKLKPSNIFLLNKRSFIRKVPRGVVGIISPWNYPFTIPMYDVITALLCGNSVILKTASESQLVANKIAEAFNSIKLPDFVFNLVNIKGSIFSETLIDERIDKIFFTGSVAVGKSLMAKCAKNLIPLSLELGGNDAMIICEDADLDRAASGAVWGGFQNSGQSCGGIERIYVVEKVYEEFLNKLKTKTEHLRIKKIDDYNSDMGHITTPTQVEIIKSHINDAVEKGAVIYAQSKTLDIHDKKYIPATVITNVNHDMVLMKEETFGPVVGVMKVKDTAEAVHLTNDSDLGLTASVWSKNLNKAIDISKQIKVGAVNINDHLMSHGMAETPWGGFKESGNGRSHGEFGFVEMTQPQVIIYDRLHFLKKNIWWHPYSKDIYDGIKGIIEFLYSPKIKTKFIGLIKLLKLIPRVVDKN